MVFLFENNTFDRMKKYYPSITLLRGIAAMMVCVYHIFSYSDERGSLLPLQDPLRKIAAYGSEGVFMFFVISGFVIPLSLFHSGFKLGDFPRYIARRWVRIELPYLAALLIMLVDRFIMHRNWNIDFGIDWQIIVHHIFYTIPFSNYPWINVIFWTLAIELQFYVVVGVLFSLLNSPKKWVPYVAIAIFTLSPLVIEDARFVFHYAPLFAMGMYVLHAKKIDQNKLVSAAVISAIAVFSLWLHGPKMAGIAYLSALFILLVDMKKNTGKWLGERSYSLYLIHGAVGLHVIHFLYEYAEVYILRVVLALLGIAASVAVAHYFWYFVEDKARKFSKRIDVKK
ncbi:MAG: acyltransferase family protein [Cryomorphaceae bacterium]|nr:acyltransferase family protein [Cryomorphaceae bacterium]